MAQLSKPRDVRLEDFERMREFVPQGCEFVRSRAARYWRNFHFRVTGKPSKVSRLRIGDDFVLSCVRTGR